METETQVQAETQEVKNETLNKPAVGEKSFVTTILLCLFLGGFGAHRFYVGKKGSAIAILLLCWVGTWITFGLTGLAAGIWVLVDLINIIMGKFKTADGQDLVR